MLRAQLPGRSYRLFLLALIVPCVLAVAPAILAYYGEVQLRRAFAWVSHTGEVERAIQRVFRAVLEAETAQRGYVLTGDAGYREQATTAMEAMPREIAELRRLTRDNAVQQRNLDELDGIVAKKTDVLRENIELVGSGRGEEAKANTKSGRGRRAMNEVRTKLDEMTAEENRLLVLRRTHLERMARMATGLMVALVGIMVLFAITVFLMLRRILRLQSLVTICAWSRTVEYEGEWLSIEEYLLRRFNINTTHGIAPEEMERVFGTPPGRRREG